LAGCSASDEERVGAIPTMLAVQTQTPLQLHTFFGNILSDEAKCLSPVAHRLEPS
jgi:hypothetical protein